MLLVMITDGSCTLAVRRVRTWPNRQYSSALKSRPAISLRPDRVEEMFVAPCRSVAFSVGCCWSLVRFTPLFQDELHERHLVGRRSRRLTPGSARSAARSLVGSARHRCRRLPMPVSCTRTSSSSATPLMRVDAGRGVRRSGTARCRRWRRSARSRARSARGGLVPAQGGEDRAKFHGLLFGNARSHDARGAVARVTALLELDRGRHLAGAPRGQRRRRAGWRRPRARRSRAASTRSRCASSA